MAAVVEEVSTAGAGEVFTQEAVEVIPAAPTRVIAAGIMDTAARTFRAAITVVDIMATADMVIMAADITGMVDMAGMAAGIGATRDMDGE
jgi:hypothetical protein